MAGENISSKRESKELEVAELQMFRFSVGLTRMDMIGNKDIRKTAQVRHFGDEVRVARLRWLGHEGRRDS